MLVVEHLLRADDLVAVLAVVVDGYHLWKHVSTASNHASDLNQRIQVSLPQVPKTVFNRVVLDSDHNSLVCIAGRAMIPRVAEGLRVKGSDKGNKCKTVVVIR